MCIEPPLPRAHPCDLPVSSASTPTGLTPIKYVHPWTLYAEIILSCFRIEEFMPAGRNQMENLLACTKKTKKNTQKFMKSINHSHQQHKPPGRNTNGRNRVRFSLCTSFPLKFPGVWWSAFFCTCPRRLREWRWTCSMDRCPICAFWRAGEYK